MKFSEESHHQSTKNKAETIWDGSMNIPICSMYRIFIYIWLELMINVGQHSIPEAFGFGVNSGFVLPTSIR